MSAPLPETREHLLGPAGRPGALPHLDGLVNEPTERPTTGGALSLQLNILLTLRIICKNVNLWPEANKDCIFMKVLLYLKVEESLLIFIAVYFEFLFYLI